MKYRVLLTERAESDVAGVLAWFRDQQATEAGARWFAQLMAKLETLETGPERCSPAAEAEDMGLEIRELLFGRRQHKFRLLFQVQGKTVQILRVWHSARDALSHDDL